MQKDEKTLSTDRIVLEQRAKQGWLQKKGDRHTGWKKRYFVIAQGTLYYYEDETLKTLKGKVELKTVDVEKNDGSEDYHSKRNFVFHVLTKVTARNQKVMSKKTSGRVYTFQASSKDETHDWIETIKTHILKYGQEKSFANMGTSMIIDIDTVGSEQNDTVSELPSKKSDMPNINPNSPWVVHKDPISGKLYYSNENTEAVSWEAPKEGFQDRHHVFGAILKQKGHRPSIMNLSPTNIDAIARVRESEIIDFDEDEIVYPDDAKLDLFDIKDIGHPSDELLQKPSDEDCQNYTIQKYATIHFTEDKNKKTDEKKNDEWFKKLWTHFTGSNVKPLHIKFRQDSEATKDIKQLLKNIRSFMQERQSSKKDIVMHAYKLLISLSEKPWYADEFYCLLARQLTDNPNSKSLELGWKLMTVAVTTVLPTDEFKIYLWIYLDQQENVSKEPLKTRLTFIRKLYKRTMVYGPRTYVPLPQEIARTIELKDFPMQVEDLLGNKVTARISAQSTAKDLIIALSEGSDSHDALVNKDGSIHEDPKKKN